MIENEIWPNNWQGFVAFESIDQPGNYIRHNGSSLKVHNDDGSELFQNDASFELITQAVTIKSKNVPTHSFGIGDNTNELYIFADKKLAFHVEVPGLSGDSDSVSFKSIENGTYFYNDNGLLNLKSIEQSVDFKKAATFKIEHDKFFDVSNVFCTFVSNTSYTF